MEEEKNVEIVDVFVAAEGAAAGSSTTRLELAAGSKEAKYSELATRLRRPGRESRVVALGFGARGGIPRRTVQHLKELGVEGRELRELLRRSRFHLVHGLADGLSASRRLEKEEPFSQHSRLAAWAAARKGGGRPKTGVG